MIHFRPFLLILMTLVYMLNDFLYDTKVLVTLQRFDDSLLYASSPLKYKKVANVIHVKI